VGSYTVSATSSGFETLKVQKVQVSAGAIYSLPLKLAVAAQATTVEVNAAGLSLDTTTPTQTTILSGAAIQDIPLNGRDFTQMIGMAPGFAGYALGGFGSVNGTRGNQVNWQIDGSDNNDLWHNIPAVNQGNSFLGWFCMDRLFASPIFIAGLAVSRLLARFGRAKRLTSYALLVELGTIALLVTLFLFLVGTRRG